MTRTVLVVDDEPKILQVVRDYLADAGFTVTTASDGTTALAQARAVPPDLVVLDLGLPGLDGLEVCRQVQKDRPVPVLMLTARDSETDMLIGLAVGADDYMTKPFSPRELVARVHAILRRMERTLVLPGTGAEPSALVTVGDVELDARSRRVRRAGEEVHLTPTEFDLLSWLAAHPGAVATREQLLHQVWGYRDGSGARTVDSHVRSLRRKLGSGIVRTVHGVGYALEAR